VRSDLPVAVVNAIERCDRASLVFDLARVEANLVAFANASRVHGITVLFAAKSFPHPAVRSLAARLLDGFDAASGPELAELPQTRVVSVVDPSGRAGATARADRLIVGCETVDQVRAAPTRAEIAIRLSASLTGRDPAIGAVQAGRGHHRPCSADVDPEPGARRSSRWCTPRPVVRSGCTCTTARWLPPVASACATARAALEAAAQAGFEPRFLDVGGAWHAVPEVATALAELRAAVPPRSARDRAGSRDRKRAGFAWGRVPFRASSTIARCASSSCRGSATCAGATSSRRRRAAPR
jgi:hypothetical protein